MPTQFIKKMNKTEAGFHLLMMLSMADDHIHHTEHDVIIDFLNDHFNDNIDLIKEQAFLKALPASEQESHFMETAEHLFAISNADERHTITRFAMDVVMADETMQHHENKLINKLYDCWDIE
ncbi:MAG: TerB family tellurite resistance protein [Bacteroidia bacterium]|jgi:uncharacterized tellurite resistance protein B-like protein